MGIAKDVIPLVYAIINISHTAIGIPTGILADKIGKEKVLTIGYAVFVISSLLMVLFTGRGVDGVVNNFLYASVLAAVFGIYVGISEDSDTKVCFIRAKRYSIWNI